MLKKTVALLLIVTLFAAVPLVSVELFRTKPRSFQTDSPPKKSRTEVLTAQLAARFSEAYSDDTLTAIAILLNTNLRYAEEHNEKSNEKSLTKKAFVAKFDKGTDYYSKLENIIQKTQKKFLRYKGRIIHVPIAKLRGAKSEQNLPYLKNAASPWDTLDKSYNPDNPKNAVSIIGIEALCRLGTGYKHALRHYISFD